MLTINTYNKKLLFGNNKCNGRIYYYRDTNEFYIVTKHNNLCQKKKSQYMIITTIYKLISIFIFKKYALQLFISKKTNLILLSKKMHYLIYIIG
mgnify:CR=1 FL=1